MRFSLMFHIQHLITACTSCQVVILPHLKRGESTQVSNSAEFSPKKDLQDLWWLGLKHYFDTLNYTTNNNLFDLCLFTLFTL